MEKKIRIAIPVNFVLSVNYENALLQLGAEPVFVTGPCCADDFEGLLLPGGDDMNPARYGMENQGSEGIDDELDALQLQVLDCFVKAKKPIFGICRGFQVINVYFGGTLIQDIQSPIRHKRLNGEDQVHVTKTSRESWLRPLYGDTFSVNSSHHQGVCGDIGQGLSAVQWSEDGIVEALQHETLPIRCVQWHPERMSFAHRRCDTVDGSLVIAEFLKAAGMQLSR